MTKRHKHIDQWCHNRRFLSTLSPEYPDWIVTVAFYTALHSVDALLAKDSQRVTCHGDRNDILIRTNRYSHIRKHYLELYGLARTVRYLADPTAWVPHQDIMNRVIKGLLYPVENSVMKLMGEKIDLPRIVLQPTLSTLPVAEPPAPEDGLSISA